MPDLHGPEPHILELRIHGVNNTPPEDMLDAARDDIEQTRGDSLGAFWSMTPAALTRGRESEDPHRPDNVPPTIRREAYSWGRQARVTGAAWASTHTLARAFSRAGWLLLLPLGLTNAAYWARRLEPAASQQDVSYGRGAWCVRLFGFLLTLLLVTALTTVSLDLVARQCLPSVAGACKPLPGWIGSLGAFGLGRRLAVLSVVPLLGLGILSWLSSSARARYEGPTSTPLPRQALTSSTEKEPAGAPPPSGGSSPEASGPSTAPALATDGFWSRLALIRSVAALHFAGGLSLISVTLAVVRLWGGRDVCVEPTAFDFHRCVSDSWPHSWPWILILAAALLLVILAGAATAISTPQSCVSGSAWRRCSWKFVFSLSALLYGAVVIWLFLENQSEPPGTSRHPLLGLSFVPVVLVALALLIALVGTTWRRAHVATVLATLAAVGAAAGLLTGQLALIPRTGTAGPGSDLTTWATLAAFAALGVIAFVPNRSEPPRWLRMITRRHEAAPPDTRQPASNKDLRGEAWWGAGPGVLLLISLGLHLMLMSLIVLAVGDWLNGARPPQCLVLAGPLGQGCGGPTSEGLPLEVPLTYGVFAAAAFFGLLLALLGVAFMALFHYARSRGTAESEPYTGDDAGRPRPAGTLQELAKRPELQTSCRQARNAAAVEQQVTKALGIVAAALTATVVTAVVLVARGEWIKNQQALIEFTTIGTWCIVGLWGLALLKIVVGSPSSDRPLALLFDVLCFLPRSAHPFAPPCYAERAVPEIAARVDAWLLDGAPKSESLDDVSERESLDDVPEREQVDSPPRAVVLSAHSLGGILAVAAIFARADEEPRQGRIALLTHGSQLGTYFGRLLPELLGPTTLGTSASRGPRLGPDPWRSKSGAEPVTAQVPLTDNLTGRLGGPDRLAWLNLWRPTDPLGMPVPHPIAGGINREAEEIDPSGYVAVIATHGGYTRTDAYRNALAGLVDLLS